MTPGATKKLVLSKEGESPPPSNIALAIASLGIVFGDIGTSPLYTLKACFNSSSLGVSATIESVFGVLSLIFWALLLVLTLKYVTVLLRAQFQGEGGIFAMLSLIKRTGSEKGRAARSAVILLVAICGAALLYGDGVVTPSISVLSAAEGLESVSDRFDDYIVPIALVVLLGLFLWQRVGTQKIAVIFSPIMIAWFVAMGVFGLMSIMKTPQILEAVNPGYAIDLFQAQPWRAFILLSLIVLCITGGEALYADLGQFNRRSITIAWCGIVWPSLLLNYFGQGAWLLGQTHEGKWGLPAPETDMGNPFFQIIPDMFSWPMIGLALLAAVIASQAIITGLFSLTRQAIQIGLLPFMRIVHTSGEKEGQIYLPAINRAMGVGCVLAVLIFLTPEHLAAAYGVAVTTVMTTTTILLAVVAKKVWKWPMWGIAPMIMVFIAVDLSFLGANLFKIPEGGWFPLVIAFMMILLMTTWRAGRAALAKQHPEANEPLSDFLAQVPVHQPARVPGTGVFLTAMKDTTPSSLVNLYMRMPVLHERVIIMSMVPSPVARLPRSKQLDMKELGHGFCHVEGHHGYLQVPNVPRLLQLARNRGLEIDMERLSYFTRREIVMTGGESPMWLWRKGLFAWMARNASSMTDVFELPSEQVVEIGLRVDV